MKDRVRIFIVEDSEVTRHGLKAILSRIGTFEICGETADGKEAVELVCRSQPDVMLVDIGLPSLNGVEVTRLVKERVPSIKAVMLTSHDDEDDMFRSFAAGADGYIVKGRFSGERLEAAIQTVCGNACWLDPLIAQRILSSSAVATTVSAFPGARSASIQPLTEPEMSVLQKAAEQEPPGVISDCSGGVCTVEPTFLQRLNRFARNQNS